MDFLFLLLLMCLAGFFLLWGSWKHASLAVFIGTTFLILSSMFVLSSGVEVVNGTRTQWDEYNVLTVDTDTGYNTTVNGAKVVSETYDRLPRDWEIAIAVVFMALSIYLLYASVMELKEYRW